MNGNIATRDWSVDFPSTILSHTWRNMRLMAYPFGIIDILEWSLLNNVKRIESMGKENMVRSPPWARSICIVDKRHLLTKATTQLIDSSPSKNNSSKLKWSDGNRRIVSVRAEKWYDEKKMDSKMIQDVRGPWRPAWQLQLVGQWQFSVDLYPKKTPHCCRLNQLKSWVNSHTALHYACINFRSFSAP